MKTGPEIHRGWWRHKSQGIKTTVRSLEIVSIVHGRGIASDTRIQFWCTLALSVHRVSQLHLHLVGGLQHLVPVFPARFTTGILQFFSLVFWNHPDLSLLPLNVVVSFWT